MCIALPIKMNGEGCPRFVFASFPYSAMQSHRILSKLSPGPVQVVSKPRPLRSKPGTIHCWEYKLLLLSRVWESPKLRHQLAPHSVQALSNHCPSSDQAPAPFLSKPPTIQCWEYRFLYTLGGRRFRTSSLCAILKGEIYSLTFPQGLELGAD